MAFAVAGATSLAYLTLLGWHESKYTAPGSSHEEGPYEPWQVVTLIAVLALVAAVAGALGRVIEGAITMAVTLTLMWSVDSETIPSNEGSLWPLGAVAILIATMGLALLVATVAHKSRRQALNHQANDAVNAGS